MQGLFLDEEIEYTGRQLRSLWIYDRSGLQGDSVVAFTGPCSVSLADMVDQADVREGAHIFSRSMLHFIAEHFDMDLEKTICRQRLLVSLAQDSLLRMNCELPVCRDGDDLYLRDRKLSVSIATLTPVSTIIHFGLNIISEGTPVPAAGLADFGLDPRAFGSRLLERYVEEMEGIVMARAKVRGVV